MDTAVPRRVIPLIAASLASKSGAAEPLMVQLLPPPKKNAEDLNWRPGEEGGELIHSPEGTTQEAEPFTHQAVWLFECLEKLHQTLKRSLDEPLYVFMRITGWIPSLSQPESSE